MQSGIDYRVLHLSIKRMLCLTADTSFGQRVMAHFNKNVFSHSIKASEHIVLPNDLPEDEDEDALIAHLQSTSFTSATLNFDTAEDQVDDPELEQHLCTFFWLMF